MKSNLFIWLIVLSGLVSCAIPKVISDHDESANYAGFKSFRMCSDYPKVVSIGGDSVDVSTLVKIREAIITEAKLKGLTETESNPDLEFSFEVKTEAKEESFVSCKMENEYDYWPTCTVQNRRYTGGSLLIAATDLSKKQVVWQGVVEGELANNVSPSEKWIQKLVKKIMDTYPS